MPYTTKIKCWSPGFTKTFVLNSLCDVVGLVTLKTTLFSTLHRLFAIHTGRVVCIAYVGDLVVG